MNQNTKMQGTKFKRESFCKSQQLAFTCGHLASDYNIISKNRMVDFFQIVPK